MNLIEATSDSPLSSASEEKIDDPSTAFNPSKLPLVYVHRIIFHKLTGKIRLEKESHSKLKFPSAKQKQIIINYCRQPARH